MHPLLLFFPVILFSTLVSAMLPPPKKLHRVVAGFYSYHPSYDTDKPAIVASTKKSVIFQAPPSSMVQHPTHHTHHHNHYREKHHFHYDDYNHAILSHFKLSAQASSGRRRRPHMKKPRPPYSTSSHQYHHQFQRAKPYNHPPHHQLPKTPEVTQKYPRKPLNEEEQQKLSSLEKNAEIVTGKPLPGGLLPSPPRDVRAEGSHSMQYSPGKQTQKHSHKPQYAGRNKNKSNRFQSPTLHGKPLSHSENIQYVVGVRRVYQHYQRLARKLAEHYGRMYNYSPDLLYPSGIQRRTTVTPQLPSPLHPKHEVLQGWRTAAQLPNSTAITENHLPVLSP